MRLANGGVHIALGHRHPEHPLATRQIGRDRDHQQDDGQGDPIIPSGQGDGGEDDRLIGRQAAESQRRAGAAPPDGEQRINAAFERTFPIR